MGNKTSFIKDPLVKGILYANLFGLITTVASRLLLDEIFDMDGVIVVSVFFLIPISMGLISAYFWNKKPSRGITYLVNSLWNFMGVLLWSWFILKEGYFCLIIVSPIIIASLVTGAYLGRLIFKRNKEKLNLSIIGILLAIYVVDISTSNGYVAVVSDEIIINAPPDVVWKNVVEFPEITDKPKFWMFRIGMPMPMETTVSAAAEGEGRECIFNDEIIFIEKMTVFVPEKNLTFDIIEQPAHPEIIGHIIMDKGQFRLEDMGDGRTKLIGTSWYTLLVHPVWYYNTWAVSITRNVHMRVMKHIKVLSENEQMGI